MNAKDFMLAISVEIIGSLIHIRIRDIGTGISPGVLGKLTALFKNKGEVLPNPFFLKHTGIFSIYRRFLLAYEDMNIEITSTPQKETKVFIRIPYRS